LLLTGIVLFGCVLKQISQRMGKSWVWNHYEKQTGGLAVCLVNHCGKVLQGRHGTTSLIAHLNSQHQLSDNSQTSMRGMERI
jgi:hypothetical protein